MHANLDAVKEIFDEEMAVSFDKSTYFGIQCFYYTRLLGFRFVLCEFKY